MKNNQAVFLTFALVGDVGTTFSLPNYTGELYTANKTTTLLNLIGGITNGGGLYSPNLEHPTAQLYDLPAPKQPAISEDESVAGVTPTHVARTQETNIAQIYQEAINVSYLKQANGGRLSGLNTSPTPGGGVINERDFQVEKKLVIIARDINHVLHNGVYSKAATSADVNQTRGMLEAIATLGGVTTDVAGATLTKEIIDAVLADMSDNGAFFEDMVMLAPASVKVQISEVYGLAPQDRNLGGINIKQIETDFGNIMVGIDPFIPAGTLGIYDLSTMSLVFQTVPDKGNLFYEELGKVGASEGGQLYGIIGFDHGPGFVHGSITNIG